MYIVLFKCMYQTSATTPDSVDTIPDSVDEIPDSVDKIPECRYNSG